VQCASIGRGRCRNSCVRATCHFHCTLPPLLRLPSIAPQPPTEALSDTVGVVYPRSHKLDLGSGAPCNCGYFPLEPADLRRLRKVPTSCCVYLFWQTFIAADCTPPVPRILGSVALAYASLTLLLPGFGIGGIGFAVTIMKERLPAPVTADRADRQAVCELKCRCHVVL
jgi:hypothetical protein